MLRDVIIISTVCKLFRATAFRLQKGNCLDVVEYTPWQYDDEGGHDSTGAAYELFLRDPLRVASVRTLVLWDSSMEPLAKLDLTRLCHFTLHLSIDNYDGTSLDAFNRKRLNNIECVAEAFTKAASEQRPLHLQTLNISGPNLIAPAIFRSPVFLQFLFLLQHAPLKHLDLSFGYSNEHNSDMAVDLPHDVVFKSLQHLSISTNIVLPSMSVAAPNLQTIEIEQLGTPSAPPAWLRTLTQPNLTRFQWSGHHWDTALSFLPIDTLRNLTDVTLSGNIRTNDLPAANTGLHNLCKSLIQGGKITSFNIYFHYHTWLTCSMVSMILSHLSKALKELYVPITDWDYDLILKALKRFPALRKVQLEFNPDDSVPLVVKRGGKELLEDLGIKDVSVTFHEPTGPLDSDSD
ncbi:hypothetical protein HDV00_005775 [Rhizophlyctis rosea]|nr:hypothetical protein HDV00_005775 [Rhizophlyctis rosea]